MKFVTIPWVQKLNLLVQSNPPFQLCHLLIQGWVLTVQQQISLIGQEANLHVARLTIVTVNTPCPSTMSTLQQKFTKKNSSFNCKFLKKVLTYCKLNFLRQLLFLCKVPYNELHSASFVTSVVIVNISQPSFLSSDKRNKSDERPDLLWRNEWKEDTKRANDMTLVPLRSVEAIEFWFCASFCTSFSHNKVSLHFNSFQSVLSMHRLWS